LPLIQYQLGTLRVRSSWQEEETLDKPWQSVLGGVFVKLLTGGLDLYLSVGPED